MQSYRITSTLPRSCRPLAAPTRTLSTHFPSFLSSDFAPLWRLLDDSLHQQTAASPQRNTTRIFTPRFDVREAVNSYELHGEMPGIRQEDLDIQFVDPHTLVIKGRTETEFSRGTPAGTENTTSTTASAEPTTENAPQPSSPSYHKATVEDDYVDASASSSASAPPTPTSSTATEVAQAPPPASKDAVTKKAEPEYKYWVNERSIGEFTRTFQFPGTVDQEAVKASLKNGILRVVVPKLVRAERRIVVE